MRVPLTDRRGSGRIAYRRIAIATTAAVGLFVAGFLVAVLAWQFVGGGVWRREVSVALADLRSPRTLTLLVNSCDGNPEVSLLRETDVDVQVEVVASTTPLRGGSDCRDAVEVQLRQPLGDRAVIDKHTGQPVSVRTVN